MDVEYHESDAAHHIDPAHLPAAIDWVDATLVRGRAPKIGRSSRCAVTVELGLASRHAHDPLRAQGEASRDVGRPATIPSMVETFLTPLGPRLVEALRDRGRHARARRRRRHRQRLDPGRRPRRPRDRLRPHPRAARGRPPPHRRSTSSGSTADAEALPFDDESFEVVMSAIGVMFAPHHADAADELVRVCELGGTIGLLTWTPEGMLGALFRTMAPFAPPPPARRVARAAVGQRGATSAACSATASSGSRWSATCSTSPRSRAPTDYGEFFKARYGPTIAIRANAERNGREAEFDAALDAFCDEWNLGPRRRGASSRWSTCSRPARAPKVRPLRFAERDCSSFQRLQSRRRRAELGQHRGDVVVDGLG